MLVSGWGRRRDHNNERPLDPPVPNVVALVPSNPERTPPELPEPDLEGVIAPDQELDDAHAFDPDAAYRLAAWTWGHEFGVSWAAYVAGLGTSHRWTMRQLKTLRFLRWKHRKDGLS